MTKTTTPEFQLTFISAMTQADLDTLFLAGMYEFFRILDKTVYSMLKDSGDLDSLLAATPHDLKSAYFHVFQNFVIKHATTLSKVQKVSAIFYHNEDCLTSIFDPKTLSPFTKFWASEEVMTAIENATSANQYQHLRDELEKINSASATTTAAYKNST